MRAAIAALIVAVGLPGVARAEDWTWSSGDPDDAAGARVRYSLNLNIWVSTYDRPNTACRPSEGFAGGGEVFFLRKQSALRRAQVPPGGFSFCNSENSDETGAGPGIDVQFRAFGPLYVTVGLDIFYTDPSSFAISNQWVIAVPFGIRLTWPHWMFRPIAEALITPVLYLTDDGRDYTLGGRGGLAVRLGGAGDLSLLIGYQTAETLKNVSVTIGFQPIL